MRSRAAQDQQQAQAEVHHAEERLEATRPPWSARCDASAIRCATPFQPCAAHLGESSFVPVDPHADRVGAVLGEAELAVDLGMQGGHDPVGTGRRSREPIVDRPTRR